MAMQFVPMLSFQKGPSESDRRGKIATPDHQVRYNLPLPNDLSFRFCHAILGIGNLTDKLFAVHALTLAL
jgi:hypothetical protein